MVELLVGIIISIIAFFIGLRSSKKQNQKTIKKLERSIMLLCDELNRNAHSRKFYIEYDKEGNPKKVASAIIEINTVADIQVQGIAPKICTNTDHEKS